MAEYSGIGSMGKDLIMFFIVVFRRKNIAMSRFGTRHWIQSKLRYINGHRFTFAVYLIASKCRGCVYTLTNIYKEHYKNRVLLVTPDEVKLMFDNGHIWCHDLDLIVTIKDKSYYYDKRIFNIHDDFGEVIGISAFDSGLWIVMGHSIDALEFKLADPKDLWQSIQELALCTMTDPVLSNIIKMAEQ